MLDSLFEADGFLEEGGGVHCWALPLCSLSRGDAPQTEEVPLVQGESSLGFQCGHGVTGRWSPRGWTDRRPRTLPTGTGGGQGAAAAEDTTETAAEAEKTAETVTGAAEDAAAEDTAAAKDTAAAAEDTAAAGDAATAAGTAEAATD